MKILVCIKQVPGSTNVEVDPITGVLKRVTESLHMKKKLNLKLTRNFGKEFVCM